MAKNKFYVIFFCRILIVVLVQLWVCYKALPYVILAIEITKTAQTALAGTTGQIPFPDENNTRKITTIRKLFIIKHRSSSNNKILITTTATMIAIAANNNTDNNNNDDNGIQQRLTKTKDNRNKQQSKLLGL